MEQKGGRKMALHLVLIFGGMVVCAIFAVGSFTLADHFSNLFKCLKDLKSLLYLSLCVLFAMLAITLAFACLGLLEILLITSGQVFSWI